jgi:hypothetical protein
MTPLKTKVALHRVNNLSFDRQGLLNERQYTNLGRWLTLHKCNCISILLHIEA